MSNAVFPVLPGLNWNVVKTPTWSTKIQPAVSGKELRASYFKRPIWKFQLSYEFLRANAHQEFQSLLAFFNQRQGAFDSFLFTDPSDHTVTDQPFGIGDGVTRVFTLLHSIGGWVEPIGYSNSGIIMVDGVSISYPTEFNSDGLNITFANPPAVGASITWTGTFYYRVRFLNDALDLEEFMQDFWNAKKVELVGVI